MAEYIRFEVYIPTYYTITETDQETRELREVTYEVDPRLVRAFVDDTRSKYRGVTQSNPAAVSPFKGWWQERANKPIVVDHLILVFGL